MAQTAAMEARAMARALREMEKAEMSNPSEKAREIVRARNEKGIRESLEMAARDMGISANELATEILAEREMQESAKGESREIEIGYPANDSRERREMVMAEIEKAHSREDYRIARELLTTIGREYGAVVSSTPNGEIAVFGTYRAIDPEYARALQEKAIAGVWKVEARIVEAETAIEKSQLKKGTPAMQKELADAERAMKVARARMEKANALMENANAISADGIRLEEKARFHSDDYKLAIVRNDISRAIEAWELPNSIVRRPFREYIRPRIRRNPISPVECEILRNEANAEKAIVRAKVRAMVEARIAEKANAEKLEKENKKSANAAARKLANTIRMRNARMAKRNAR